MSMAAPIQAIILDLGNVLIFYNENVERRNLAQLIGVTQKQLMPSYFTHLPAFQKGKISSREFIARICKSLGKQTPASAAQFYGKMIRQIGQLDQSMVDLLPKLKRYKLAVLSNTIDDHVRFLRTQHWLKHFDYLFFSNERTLRKPEAAAFRFVARKLGVKPRACIFTDDKLPYAKAARRVGMHAVQFKSPSQFKRFLKRNGVVW